MTEKAQIVDLTLANFESEAILRSQETPVLIDFWATWCGPCKELTPLLEERANQGRFVLAKVDIDANPELAQAFRVQAVPTVLALVNGQPVDGFQGGLPAAELDAFLDRVAPGGEEEPDALQAEIELLLGEGRRDEALAMLKEVREVDDEHVTARLMLTAMALEDGDVDLAREVFDEVPEDARDSEEARALAARLEFSAGSGTLAELEQKLAAAPEDVEVRIELAKALAAEGQSEKALELLLDEVRADPGGRGQRARAGMLEIFELLGLEDPVANDYRFKLSLELFA